MTVCGVELGHSEITSHDLHQNIITFFPWGDFFFLNHKIRSLSKNNGIFICIFSKITLFLQLQASFAIKNKMNEITTPFWNVKNLDLPTVFNPL